MALFDFLKRKKEKEERGAVKEKNAPMPEKHAAKAQLSEAKERASLVARFADESRRESRRAKIVSGRMLADVIRPHVTERSREMSQRGVYMFRVSEKATKHTVARAIEALYRVSVDGVRMMRIPSKPRRRGLTRGTKKGYKKAAVILRKGEHIDLFS